MPHVYTQTMPHVYATNSTYTHKSCLTYMLQTPRIRTSQNPRIHTSNDPRICYKLHVYAQVMPHVYTQGMPHVYATNSTYTRNLCPTYMPHVYVQPMPHVSQIVVATLQILLIATRGHRAYSSKELDFIFLEVGTQFFRSLEALAACLERKRCRRLRILNNRNPDRHPPPTPFMREARYYDVYTHGLHVYMLRFHVYTHSPLHRHPSHICTKTHCTDTHCIYALRRRIHTLQTRIHATSTGIRTSPTRHRRTKV